MKVLVRDSYNEKGDTFLDLTAVILSVWIN